ncbi:MAG: hypothetical protein J6K41_04515 [Paraprevotella sp.]|nr:hypothetical protein [Paraprevotella sp.]
MEGLFDFICEHLPDNWFDGIHNAWGDSLSDEVVIQSVQEASDFFNMNAPMNVHEDWTTGVITGMSFTECDDILVFNREQMLNMGITDKEGFDLVMTHEGAHRALQGLNTGFDSHQEELCCDYMAGVRAGLNGMDEGKLAASLAGAEECETHPDGAARVKAIEEGVTFAHDYMDEHNGVPPSFSDCLEHFEQQYAIDQTETGNINLRPESNVGLAAITSNESVDDNLGVSSDDVNELKERADGIERKDNEMDNTIKGIKICATRHGCTGATNCDYGYGAPIGR